MTELRATASMEEVGYLTGGPARAAEVALARLLNAQLIRISRDGLVSAVLRPGSDARTALETQVLDGLRTGGRHLHEVVREAAERAEAAGMRTRVIDHGLLRAQRDRSPRLWPWLLLIGLGLGAMAFIGGPVWATGAIPVLIWGAVLMGRDPGRSLTRAGHKCVGLVERDARYERVAAVAVGGLRGKVGLFSIARMFGLTPEIVRMLPEDHRSPSGCGGD